MWYIPHITFFCLSYLSTVSFGYHPFSYAWAMHYCRWDAFTSWRSSPFLSNCLSTFMSLFLDVSLPRGPNDCYIVHVLHYPHDILCLACLTTSSLYYSLLFSFSLSISLSFTLYVSFTQLPLTWGWAMHFCTCVIYTSGHYMPAISYFLCPLYFDIFRCLTFSWAFRIFHIFPPFLCPFICHCLGLLFTHNHAGHNDWQGFRRQTDRTAFISLWYWYSYVHSFPAPPQLVLCYCPS